MVHMILPMGLEFFVWHGIMQFETIHTYLGLLYKQCKTLLCSSYFLYRLQALMDMNCAFRHIKDFCHGRDVSWAMVMWPPCWKVTD